MTAEQTPTPPPCDDCGGTLYRLALNKITQDLIRVPCACNVKDLPLKLVYQRERSDCLVAAVATAIGKPYQDIRFAYDLTHDFSDEGMHMNAAASILDRYGYAVQWRYATDPRLNYAPRNPWPPAPWADVTICDVRTLSEHCDHAVVLLRDGRVLDPYWGVLQGLHRFTKVNSMMAVYAVNVEKAA